MKRFIIITAFFAVLGAAIFWADGGPQAKTASAMNPEVLEAEYTLARGPSFYFILDLEGRKMELKAKGMVMKTWETKGLKFWGLPDFPAAVEISGKTALRAPKRFEIKPAPVESEPEAEEDPAEFELDALEVTDMPGGFTLHARGGERISVRTKKGSVWSLPGAIISSLVWHAYIPSRHLVRTLLGKPGFAIEIVLSEKEESQSVYWTFFEGIKGIIF